jgi:glucoamylase
VKAWTVTTTGPYDGHRYFIRESVSGNPDTAQTYDLGNGSFSHVDQRTIIDAGFLELTRLGELPANDPDVQTSLRVVDSILMSQTSSGPGWHRYGIRANGSSDGYGDCFVPDPTHCAPNGAPWFGPGAGSGHLWPLLGDERAEHELQTGDRPAATALGIDLQRMSWGVGMLPEQVWEDPYVPASPYGANPATASIGFFNGQAAGSAGPLVWAQASYIRLIRDLQTSSLLDQPAITRTRYVDNGPPVRLPLTITAPRPNSTTTASTTVVSGTTTSGAEVDVAASQPGSAANTTVVCHTVAAQGKFQCSIPTPPGKTVITATATAGPHATGWGQEMVSGK